MMIETRRHVLDMLQSGPALFAGLPGDEVDLDRLAAHLVGRGIDGGIYATDGSLEGLLWIQDGAPGEAWFFEAGGQEAVLPVTSSRDLMLDIAARGGTISVFVGAQPPAVATGFGAATDAGSGLFSPGPAVVADPSTEMPASEAGLPAASPFDPAAFGADLAAALQSIEMITASNVRIEPPSHPWPEILTEMAARVVRHRGAKLAGQFAGALAHALGEHGGRLDGDRVVAPPLSETVWRTIVEAACVPIVSVAGRAFVDRTIAAAERAVLERKSDPGADL